MNNYKALIIDDEPDICELLKITLSRMNIDSVICYNYKDAIKYLTAMPTKNRSSTNPSKESSRQSFDLCLTDMKLPDGNGLDIVSYIQEHSPELPVTVITAHGSIELAINALKRGAFDFITKPIDLAHLKQMISNALKLNQIKINEDLPELVGSSESMSKLRRVIHQVARSQAPIYISGPSGVGKELVAHCIHQASSRSEGPMITINCGAIPKELMESEFFGYTKGSFTGATSDKKGLFEAAHQGTLFLDEVADLPLAMQVKLLRAIQEQVIRPIGSNKEISIDVRILCATHKNLDEQVLREEFRKDLFYRLNVIEIKVPSLIQRKEDIPELIEHILHKLEQKWRPKTSEQKKGDGQNTPSEIATNPNRDVYKHKPKLSESALQKLLTYHFPGNIRELENILERAYTLCSGTIQIADLQLPESFSDENGSKEKGKSKESENDTLTRMETLISEENESAFDNTLSNPDLGLLSYMETIEREAILKALESNENNKIATAKQLGLTMRALRYRLKKLNIQE